MEINVFFKESTTCDLSDKLFNSIKRSKIQSFVLGEMSESLTLSAKETGINIALDFDINRFEVVFQHSKELYDFGISFYKRKLDNKLVMYLLDREGKIISSRQITTSSYSAELDYLMHCAIRNYSPKEDKTVITEKTTDSTCIVENLKGDKRYYYFM